MNLQIGRTMNGHISLEIVLLLLFGSYPLFCAEDSSLTEREHEELVRMVDAAVALPTEYRTDLTLAITNCLNFTDEEQKTGMLTDLFERAIYASHPTKVLSIAASSDTLGGRLEFSSKFGLDTLSIQTRIVSMLVHRSPGTARELFSRIQLKFEPVTCETPTIQDVTAYYEALGELYRIAFSEQERDEREDFYYLEAHLARVVSYSQINPIARLLVDLPLQPGDRRLLVSRYSEALTQLPSSHREFSRREVKGETSKLIYELASSVKVEGGSVSPLIIAYGSLVKRNVSEVVCADGMWSVSPDVRPTVKTGAVTETVSYFNREIRLLPADDVPPLELDEIKPGKLAEAAKTQPLHEPREFFAAFRMLRAARARQGGEAADNWEVTLSGVLRQINDPEWGTSGCTACGFHERAAVYLVLIDLAPVGDLRLEVARAMLHFLESSPMQQNSPTEWLTQLKLLLGFAQTPSRDDESKLEEAAERGLTPGMLPRGQRRELLADMIQSRNAIISSYAHLEQICPTPLDLSDRLPPSR